MLLDVFVSAKRREMLRIAELKEMLRMRRCGVHASMPLSCNFMDSWEGNWEGGLFDISFLPSDFHDLTSPLLRQGTSLAVKDNPLEPLLDILSRFVDEVNKGVRAGIGIGKGG